VLSPSLSRVLRRKFSRLRDRFRYVVDHSRYGRPVFRSRLADVVVQRCRGSSADFGKLIADETEKWAKVIKFAGVKPE
jgi:hypothetical protein